jgi:hypothetical protein
MQSCPCPRHSDIQEAYRYNSIHSSHRLYMEAAFLPGKKPSTNRIGEGMASRSRSGRFRGKKSSPCRDSNSGSSNLWPNHNPDCAIPVFSCFPTLNKSQNLFPILHNEVPKSCFREMFRSKEVCWEVTPCGLVGFHRPFE